MEIRVSRVLGIHATDERFAIAQVLKHINTSLFLLVGCEHFLIIVLERKEKSTPAVVVDVVVTRLVGHLVEDEVLLFVSVIVSIYAFWLLVLVKLEVVALVLLGLVTIILEVVELFVRHLIDRSRFQSNVERFVNLVRRLLLVSCCHLVKQSCHFCRILSDACAHVLFRFCHTSVYHFLRESLCHSHIVVCRITVSTVGDLLDGVVLVDLRVTRVSHFRIFFIHEGEGVVLLPSHHRVSRTILRSLVSTVPLFCEVR